VDTRKARKTELFNRPPSNAFDRPLQKIESIVCALSGCTTSCPDCLRDFSNLQYHSILDWRLGLDIARLALDPAASIDFTVPYWQGLDVAAAGPYFAAMPGWRQITLGGLQAGRYGNRVEIIAHPLWNIHPNFFGPQLAGAYAQAVAAGYQVTIRSIFELLRRPF
jgi:DEAD/DEAH box helicase domain-containing protein